MSSSTLEYLSNDEWIPADQALARLEKYTKNRKSAKEYLADLLRDGEIASYARKAWEVKTKDVFRLWHTDADREDTETDVEVGVDAWRNSEFWRRDCDNWRWPHGNFGITFQRKPYYMRAYNRVSFKRADFDRVLDGRAPSVGGRPRKEAEWKAFWHVIIKLAQDGRLQSYPTMGELSEDILLEIGDALSTRTIEGDVSQVFKKFCRPTP